MKEHEKKLTYGLISKYRPQLMGVAILLIVFCHLGNEESRNGIANTHLASILSTGSVGVDIFIFLSGIGLFFSFTKNPLPYLAFEKKRLLRILPSYFLIAGITYFLDDIIIHKLSLFQVFRDLFFVSWVFDGKTRYWYVLSITVFYLLFPFVYSFVHKSKRPLLKTVIFGIACFIVVEILSNLFFAVQNFRIALERLPVFFLGVYAGKLAYDNKSIKNIDLFLFFFIGFVLLALQKRVIPSPLKNYLHYPIRCALAFSIITAIILFLELLERTLSRASGIIRTVLAWFGSLTYEIYLFHQSYLILITKAYKFHTFF